MKNKIIIVCILINSLLSVKFLKAQDADWTLITIHTPRETPVIAAMPNKSLSQSEYDGFMREVAKYQNVEIINTPTNSYNCHGYAWSMTAGGSTVCIGYKGANHEAPYMSDGSYIQVCPTSQPAKISYGTDHSAVTDGSPTRVISKWYLGCLVRHELNNCPYSHGANYTYWYLTPVFEGRETKCTSSPFSYTLDVVPGATYTWSSSSNIGLSSNNNSVTATPLYNGEGWISVKITTPCTQVPITLTKQINVQVLSVSSSTPLAYFNGYTYNDVCYNKTYSTNIYIQGADNVIWSRLSANPSSTTWYQSGDNISSYFWNVNQTAVYRIIAYNACESVNYDFGFKAIKCSTDPCNPIYAISPNPVHNNKAKIVVNIPAPCDYAMKSNTFNGFISISDNQGILKKRINYRQYEDLELDLSDLQNGIHYVEIYDGKTVDKKSILIQN